ncbi:MAG: metallopeptidase family protein [bacterium]|nr:metallopeptidase family protein [bacterium]
MRVSAAEFHRLVAEALEDVPGQFRPYLDGLAIDVEPQPSARTLRRAGIDDPHDLLGLYEGTPLTERSVEEPVSLPERIVIYQNNVQRHCRTRREIVDEIRITVLHEIGHHFGLDEEDLERLGFE